MRKRIAILWGLVALMTPGSAHGATIIVQPGQSIQAAIDHAVPGDTIVVRPGTYHENLTIQKDNLTLKASDGAGSVLLLPGATATPSPCTGLFGGIPLGGICVLGQLDQNFNPLQPVTGTRIVGFAIARFPGDGITLGNAVDSGVTDTEARNNGGYGISGFFLSGVRFMRDVAHDNGEPGFYIGDSPNANALVSGSRSYRNGVGGDEGFGFFFRDSSNGVVRNNRARGNCDGYVFSDTDENPEPVSNWKVSGNYALRNDGACSDTSGIGFLLFGTHNADLRGNIAKYNVPSGPSLASGGIVVLSSAAFGGADPTDNTISYNVALNNSPFDVLWDGTGSGNHFPNNACQTSQPSWICAS